MATKNFRSTVLEPTSEFAHGDKLRFTALSSIDRVFKRSFSEVTIGVDGVYDIDLQYGKYRIDYKPYEGIWALFANVEVGAETTATTLQDLAMTSSPVTDDTILALQAILDETKANAENAEKSSIDSISAAAEAAKDRDEIEGMMLRAMTTTGVEAIRETNKNLYAASGVVEWGAVGSEPVNSLRGGLNCIDESDTLLIDGKYHIAGLTFEIPTDSKVIFPEAADGTVTYNESTGVVTKHATSAAAFAAANADVNTEVVVNRVDLFGLEYYLRAVTEEDPFVYPDGDIHSQSASIAGLPTTIDTVRPDSYFANFTGQTDVIRGKGVNWFTATNAEKLKILSESNKHGHLHYDPATAEWRQWCLRKRAIAGAGNGDLLSINPSSSELLLTAKQVVTAQADSNAAGSSAYKGSSGCLGVFSSVGDGGLECYLYIVSTHPRLNKGAYHPDFGEMGARRWNKSIDNSGAAAWYHASTSKNKDALKAFDAKAGGADHEGAHVLTGNFSTSQSGRFDNKFYDKIYPSGQGGTIDHRMSAYETGTAEVRESVLSEVYAGAYRGAEYLKLTQTFLADATIATDSEGRTIKIPYSDFSGDTSWITSADYNDAQKCHGHLIVDGVALTVISVSNSTLNGQYWINCLPDGNATADGMKVTGCIGSYTDITVSGDFINADVAAPVDKILTTPALKNGWFGCWIPANYSDVSLRYADLSFTRKAASASGIKFKGGAWSVFSADPDYSDNVVSTNDTELYDKDAVILMTYTAFAKQTKLSGRKPILNGSSGKGEVWSNSSHENAVFSESVLGKVVTGIFGNTRHSILETHIMPDGKFNTNGQSPTIHTGISLPAPANNSPAVKVLPYQSATSQQTTICFAATELKYTGSNWGDDSEIHFVDGVSTLIDTNGETVLCAAHELSMPIGYTKKVNK